MTQNTVYSPVNSSIPIISISTVMPLYVPSSYDNISTSFPTLNENPTYTYNTTDNTLSTTLPQATLLELWKETSTLLKRFLSFNPQFASSPEVFFLKKVIISYGKSNSVHVRIANTLKYAEITSKSLKI